MSEDVKRQLNEYLKDPFNRTESPLLKYVKDWFDHPEKSKLYRDKFMFQTNGHVECDDDDDYQSESGWKFEIPILSIEF